jgi:hypothetical protein
VFVAFEPAESGVDPLSRSTGKNAISDLSRDYSFEFCTTCSKDGSRRAEFPEQLAKRLIADFRALEWPEGYQDGPLPRVRGWQADLSRT